MKNTPCMNCEAREINCHSNCPKYAEYRKANETAKAAAPKYMRTFYCAKVVTHKTKIWRDAKK